MPFFACFFFSLLFFFPASFPPVHFHVNEVEEDLSWKCTCFSWYSISRQTTRTQCWQLLAFFLKNESANAAVKSFCISCKKSSEKNGTFQAHSQVRSWGGVCWAIGWKLHLLRQHLYHTGCQPSHPTRHLHLLNDLSFKKMQFLSPVDVRWARFQEGSH